MLTKTPLSLREGRPFFKKRVCNPATAVRRIAKNCIDASVNLLQVCSTASSCSCIGRAWIFQLFDANQELQVPPFCSPSEANVRWQRYFLNKFLWLYGSHSTRSDMWKLNNSFVLSHAGQTNERWRTFNSHLHQYTTGTGCAWKEACRPLR